MNVTATCYINIIRRKFVAESCRTSLKSASASKLPRLRCVRSIPMIIPHDTIHQCWISYIKPNKTPLSRFQSVATVKNFKNSSQRRMTRAGASKNKADDEHLKEIAAAVGVGVGGKNKKKTIKTLTGRQRGKPIDVLTRRRVAMRILLQKKSDTYRVLAAEFGVSQGSIKNIKDRLIAARLAIVHGRGGGAPTIELIDKALADRARVGGASKRKIGSDEEHAKFLIDLLETKEARLQSSELCELFQDRFVDTAIH